MAARLILVRDNFIKYGITYTNYSLELDRVIVPSPTLAKSCIKGINHDSLSNSIKEIEATTTLTMGRRHIETYKYTTKHLFYKWLRTTGLYNINPEPTFYVHSGHFQEDIFQSIPLTETELETVGTLFLERLLEKIKYYYSSEINERMEKYEVLFKANRMYKNEWNFIYS